MKNTTNNTMKHAAGENLRYITLEHFKMITDLDLLFLTRQFEHNVGVPVHTVNL